MTRYTLKIICRSVKYNFFLYLEVSRISYDFKMTDEKQDFSHFHSCTMYSNHTNSLRENVPTANPSVPQVLTNNMI